MKIILLSLIALQARCGHSTASSLQRGAAVAANMRSLSRAPAHQLPPAPAQAALPPSPAVPAALAPSPAADAAPTVHPSIKAPIKDVVVHKKHPGGGYKKGSPLYKKQQRRKAEAQSITDSVPSGGKSPFPKSFKWRASFSETVLAVSVYGIFVLAFAYLYKKYMGQSLKGAVREEPSSFLPVFTRCGFTYSVFDVSNLRQDWPICLWACCCPLIQWAGTASKTVTPFMNYWKAIVLMLALTIMVPFTFGLSALVMLVVLLIRRRQLRSVYNHEKPNRTLVQDICCIFCCSDFLCCMLVQEAREVEFASPKQMPIAASSDPLRPELPANFPRGAQMGSSVTRSGTMSNQPQGSPVTTVQ